MKQKEVKALFKEWNENRNNGEITKRIAKDLAPYFADETDKALRERISEIENKLLDVFVDVYN